MKTGRKRTFSICLSDLPKDKITLHDNGKKYINLSSWDYEDTAYGKDFSVSYPRTKEEAEAKAPILFLGHGKIWPDSVRGLTE